MGGEPYARAGGSDAIVDMSEALAVVVELVLRVVHDIGNDVVALAVFLSVAYRGR
jgi:hypothetical protein